MFHDSKREPSSLSILSFRDTYDVWVGHADMYAHASHVIVRFLILTPLERHLLTKQISFLEGEHRHIADTGRNHYSFFYTLFSTS